MSDGVFLGIDVGFSKRVRSTGICVIEPGNRSAPVRCAHVRTGEVWRAVIDMLRGRSPWAASLDGPLVPDGKNGFQEINRYRMCEAVLSRGVFQRRCKPGPTNSPRGQALHHQTTKLANHLMQNFPALIIAEAFPNAYLGVLAPDAVFRVPIRRGRKSDVLWEYCLNKDNLIGRLSQQLFLKADAKRIHAAIVDLEDHDERAAFVCALVARGAHLRVNFLVDGGGDGAIALPPQRLIQPWARFGLQSNLAAP